MKKLILALLMALPCFAFGQVATQKVVNTAVIYAPNSPVTFNGSATFSNVFFRTLFNAELATNMNAGELRSGIIPTARYGPEVVLTNGNQTISGIKTFNDNIIGNGTDNTLNNQTLTGNGSIVTRVLGDARYSASGGATTNSNTFADGSSQSFYDVLVRNILRVNVSTILNTNLLVNGNITVTNTAPIMALVSTNTSQVSGSLARYEAYVPGFGTGSIFGAAGSTNATIAGSLPGDTTIRGAAGTRILFGNGTALVAYFDNVPATKSLILTNGTQLILDSGNIVGGGTINTLNNQTLTGDGSILTRGTADARYDGRYTQGWAWYFASAAGTPLGNRGRSVITYADFGSGGAAAVQTDVANGESTFYNLPDTVAGKSVIVKTMFGTKSAETNAASAAVSVRHVVSYVTNLVTMTQQVPSAGDDPQGSSSVIIPVAVNQSQRWYEAVTTNTVPATARFINVESLRAGGDAGDTMTTNAYWIGLKVQVIP